MKQCENCGVVVDGSPERCPLCGRSLNERSGHSPESAGGPQTDSITAGAAKVPVGGSALSGPGAGQGESAEPTETPQRKRARFWLWEMFTIVIVATAIIVAAADFAYGFELSWSAFPLTGLATVWLFVTAVAALGRDIPHAYGTATIIVLAYLFVLDLLVGGEPWFVPFALPIGLLVAVVGGAAAGTVRSLRLSIFQTLAVALVFIGLFLIGLEVILYFAMDLDSILSWSIVALGGCLSIALLLWIINKRLRERHSDFKRLFHL